MRCFLFITLIVFAATNAGAQEYVQAQQYQPPQQVPQQQITDNYTPVQPAYNQPQYVPAPSNAAPVQHVQPGDYGQSVMTDIRQMNF